MIIPEKDKLVNLEGFGSGKILGVYKENNFPVHILFDNNICETFTFEKFDELVSWSYDQVNE